MPEREKDEVRLKGEQTVDVIRTLRSGPVYSKFQELKGSLNDTCLENANKGLCKRTLDGSMLHHFVIISKAVELQ